MQAAFNPLAIFYICRMRGLIILCLLTLAGGLIAQDAQWRGPERNGIYPDSLLLKSWPVEGPELLMKVSGIGDGYSSAVEHRGIIYVSGKMDSLDYLSAIDQDGQIIWQVAYGQAWDKTYSASRSTTATFFVRFELGRRQR